MPNADRLHRPLVVIHHAPTAEQEAEARKQLGVGEVATSAAVDREWLANVPSKPTSRAGWKHL